ncbi:MAG: ABC transporter permease [Clostridia bacterium]|nr:ABC transporter permease [Clostridia bacterium]
MLSFALKNMAIKKVQVILVAVSIIISAGVAVLAYNTANQVRDGITGTAGWYSAIIGPAGSKTQLAMNTMYFTDEPLGTIPYSVVSELQRDSRVKRVIPYAMADNYNGYRLVGTESAFLESKEIAEGKMFDDAAEYEVVLGASVAKVCDVGVGDDIFTSHSASEQHTQPLKVVGILKESHSAYDRVVFTQLKTIWAVHEHEEEHEEEEEHEHEHMENSVCAAIVSTENPSFAMTLVSDYGGKIITDEDGDSVTLQAIEPMETVRGILEETDSTKYIVYVLCAIILIMNVMVISIITLLNMYNSAKEISLMRLIGISMKKINLLYILQNGIIGLISVLLAFAVSKICLRFMDTYASSMGVVLNTAKVYPMEWVILALVFAIAVLPTIICTFVMARRDSISE